MNKDTNCSISTIFSRFGDYFLFPDLKKLLGGKRFKLNEEVEWEENAYLETSLTGSFDISIELEMSYR